MGIIPPPPPPSSRRVIFRGGLTFGVPLGLLYIGLPFLGQYVLLPNNLEPLLSLLDILLPVGVFFWAGVRGAKQTGRVGTGSLTGLVTAVFAGGIVLIYVIGAMTVLQASGYPQHFAPVHTSRGDISPQNFATIVVASILIAVILLCLLGMGAGAGIGALGGLLGRRRSAYVVSPTMISSSALPPTVPATELPPPALPPTVPAKPGDGYWQPPYPPSY